jgi:hypothetical protein
MSTKFDNIITNYLLEQDLSPEQAQNVATKVQQELSGQDQHELNPAEKVLNVLANDPSVTHIEDAYKKAGVNPTDAEKLFPSMGINIALKQQDQKPATSTDASNYGVDSKNKNQSQPSTSNTTDIQGGSSIQGSV